MAQKTIPELTEATTGDANTLFVIDSGIQTYKMKSPNVEDVLRAQRPNVVESKTADYTMNALDKIVRTSGAHTTTLPDGADCNNGDEFLIKKLDSGTTSTIAFQSSQTADAETTLTLTEQFSYFRFMWNGTEWDIVGQG